VQEAIRRCLSSTKFAAVSQEKCGGYIICTIWRVFHDEVELRQRRNEVFYLDLEEIPAEEESLESQAFLMEAVEQLSEDQRRLAHAFWFVGHSRQEIATSLGVPVGTVGSRLNTSRTILLPLLLA